MPSLDFVYDLKEKIEKSKSTDYAIFIFLQNKKGDGGRIDTFFNFKDKYSVGVFNGLIENISDAFDTKHFCAENNDEYIDFYSSRLKEQKIDHFIFTFRKSKRPKVNFSGLLSNKVSTYCIADAIVNFHNSIKKKRFPKNKEL